MLAITSTNMQIVHDDTKLSSFARSAIVQDAVMPMTQSRVFAYHDVRLEVYYRPSYRNATQHVRNVRDDAKVWYFANSAQSPVMKLLVKSQCMRISLRHDCKTVPLPIVRTNTVRDVAITTTCTRRPSTQNMTPDTVMTVELCNVVWRMEWKM